MKISVLAGLLIVIIAVPGCHHHISFEDIGYVIKTAQQDASIVVVIDPATLNQIVPIRSLMTGAAHSWDAKPGEMLQQIADVEFPQLFKAYERSRAYKEPQTKGKALTLKLMVSHYTFNEFHAFVKIRAVAYGPGKTVIFDKAYTKNGKKQGAKMFWAGAFGMKSAIRQSSFDAYKQVFYDLQVDLLKILKGL